MASFTWGGRRRWTVDNEKKANITTETPTTPRRHLRKFLLDAVPLCALGGGICFLSSTPLTEVGDSTRRQDRRWDEARPYGSLGSDLESVDLAL
jgi:hypothetical protein